MVSPIWRNSTQNIISIASGQRALITATARINTAIIRRVLPRMMQRQEHWHGVLMQLRDLPSVCMLLVRICKGMLILPDSIMRFWVGCHMNIMIFCVQIWFAVKKLKISIFTTLFMVIPANVQRFRRRTVIRRSNRRATQRMHRTHSIWPITGLPSPGSAISITRSMRVKAVLLMSILTAAMNNGLPNWG